MIDWDDLRFYLVAAQAGTVTAAADILRVSRTTVTRRVEALEHSLGISLFERTAAGAGSTEAGRLVLACARDVDGRIAEMLESLSLSGRHPNVVRIGLPAELGLDTLALYQAIAGQTQGTMLEFVQCPNPELALRERSLLVGLCIADTLPVHLKGRNLGSVRQLPFASASAPPRKDAPVWVGWGRDLDHCAAARWMNAHVPGEQVALRVNSGAELHEAVRRGIGVGYLWDRLGRDAGWQPSEHAGPVLESRLWLAMHEDVPPGPAVRDVLRVLEGHLRALIAQ